MKNLLYVGTVAAKRWWSRYRAVRPSLAIELPLDEDALNQAAGNSYNSTNALPGACWWYSGSLTLIQQHEQPVATRSRYRRSSSPCRNRSGYPDLASDSCFRNDKVGSSDKISLMPSPCKLHPLLQTTQHHRLVTKRFLDGFLPARIQTHEIMTSGRYMQRYRQA